MIEMTPMADRLETQNSAPTTTVAEAVSQSQSRASTHASSDGTGARQKTYSNLENYLQDSDPHGPLLVNPRGPMVQHSSALPVKHRELVSTTTPKKTTMRFIISKHGGFTKALYDAAQSAAATADPEEPEKGCVLKLLGLVEGPYGGHHSFDSFGTVVLVAGGVGIAHCLGYVRHLLQGYNQGTVATQKVKLIWVIRKNEHIHWVSDWLEEILRMPLCRQVLEIDIYITRPSCATSGNGWAGCGSPVKVYAGRPEFEAVLEKVVRRRIGAIAVTVCGGGGVSDSVRAATLKFVDQATIDFSEESFSW